jgi:hypothetical protein
MNKPFVLAGLLAAATLARTAHADLIHVALNGGYSTVTMAEVNDRSDKAKKAYEASGYTAKNTPLGSGWFVAAEAGLGLMPFLDLGPRVEFLQTNTGETTAEKSGLKIDTTGDATLTSAMLGANIGMDMPLTGLGFSAGLYGGYGYAVAKGSTTVNGVPAGAGQLTGGGFVGELQAKLKYSVIPLVSVDLLAGIRMANVGKLKDGTIESADPYDFSGINAGGGLTIGF